MKTREVRFRATDDEIAKVTRDAKARDLSASEYIRDRLGLGAPRPEGAPVGNRNNPHGRTGKPEATCPDCDTRSTCERHRRCRDGRRLGVSSDG